MSIHANLIHRIRRLAAWAMALLFALLLANAFAPRVWLQAMAVPALALALAGLLPIQRGAVTAAWLALGVLLLWLDALGHAGTVLGTLPVWVNAGLCWLFGRTLVGDDEPLVTRVVRVVEGEDRLAIPGVPAYTRAVTHYWAWLTGLQAVVLAACWARLQLDGAPVPVAARLWLHVGGYALPLAAMLAEYAWRRWHFRGQPHLAPHRFAMRLATRWPGIVRGSRA